MSISANQKAPCAKCPWRRDADPAYWDPQEFTKMVSGVKHHFGLMLCHKSTLPGDGTCSPVPPANRSPLSGTLDEPALCAGFVSVMGMDAIGLRMYALQHGFDSLNGISKGGLDLYQDLEHMLGAVAEANEFESWDELQHFLHSGLYER